MEGSPTSSGSCFSNLALHVDKCPEGVKTGSHGPGVSLPMTATAEKTEKDFVGISGVRPGSKALAFWLTHPRFEFQSHHLQPSFLGKPSLSKAQAPTSVEWGVMREPTLWGHGGGIRETVSSPWLHTSLRGTGGAYKLEKDEQFLIVFLFIVKITVCFWQVILVFH